MNQGCRRDTAAAAADSPQRSLAPPLGLHALSGARSLYLFRDVAVILQYPGHRYVGERDHKLPGEQIATAIHGVVVHQSRHQKHQKCREDPVGGCRL